MYFHRGHADTFIASMEGSAVGLTELLAWFQGGKGKPRRLKETSTPEARHETALAIYLAGLVYKYKKGTLDPGVLDQLCGICPNWYKTKQDIVMDHMTAVVEYYKAHGRLPGLDTEERKVYERIKGYACKSAASDNAREAWEYVTSKIQALKNR